MLVFLIKLFTAICCGFVGILVLALIAKAMIAINEWLF